MRQADSAGPQEVRAKRGTPSRKPLPARGLEPGSASLLLEMPSLSRSRLRATRRGRSGPAAQAEEWFREEFLRRDPKAVESERERPDGGPGRGRPRKGLPYCLRPFSGRLRHRWIPGSTRRAAGECRCARPGRQARCCRQRAKAGNQGTLRNQNPGTKQKPHPQPPSAVELREVLQTASLQDLFVAGTVNVSSPSR